MEVIVNAATSLDGKLSSVRREQIAISGPEDFARVDELRADVDAILVGIGTVLADDPSLTVDGSGDTVGPTRVVLDSRARTPVDAEILSGPPETVIATTETAPDERLRSLAAAGATVLVHGHDQVDVSATVSSLEARGVESLLVEGGGEVLYSCFAAGLVDRVSVFLGPMIIGGRDAPTLVDGPGFATPADFPALQLQEIERLDGGVLLVWTVE